MTGAADDRLRGLVAGLAEQVPRGRLDRLRAEQRPVSAETVDRILALAAQGPPDARLDELVAGYREGRVTWSVLRQHPRVVAATAERTDEVLAEIRRRAPLPPRPRP